ncbi:uncharacterized protein [Halyomorpha halys]|uniref:uncharacterized protein n=1 Tax=Halyomorpha halys TaxID=286706 RepID=UPI0006D51193|nr:uncharacterized protein LOC106677175 [Halyomorpha halys]
MSNIGVMSFLYMIALSSSLALVYGSRSEEEIQRRGIFEQRQILKPHVKPVMIKQNNLLQSKGFPPIISKSNQPVRYVGIPVEEGLRPEYPRNGLHPKTYGGPMPVYQVRTLAKSSARQTRPRTVYVVQPRTTEQPLHVVYHDNSVYPELSSNHISEVSSNRIPIGFKHLQGPSAYEEVVGSYNHYDGVEHFPHQEISSPYVYREPAGKENRVIIYSDGPISSIRNLPELTGNDLHTYPKYDYRTVIT